MQKLFLGVDGGSTKMDLMICDENLKEIAKAKVNSGSNLKYVGGKKVIENIKTGLEILKEEVEKQGKNPEEIFKNLCFTFLGIAECGEKNPHPEREKIITFLKDTFGKNFILDDDQLNVFRSLSSGKNGVLANAGTGSNINFFNENSEKNRTVKSVSYGGRDFGKTVLAMCAKGGFKPDSGIYKLVKNHLKTDPKQFYNSLSGQDFVITRKVTDIPKSLQENYLKDEIIQKELDSLLMIMGARWGAKISAYCLTSFGFKENEKFEIVLRGGLWSWKKMKEMAVDDILKTFPNAVILEDYTIPAVIGSCKLAIENYGEK